MCIVELIRAVDSFDVVKGVKFSAWAYKFFDTKLGNMYDKDKRDALGNLSDTGILDKDDEEVEEGLFIFIEDKTAGNFPDEIAGRDFVERVSGYIDRIDAPDRDKEILKMLLGVGYDRTYTQREIAEKFGISRSYVSRLTIPHIKTIRECILQDNPDLESYSATDPHTKNRGVVWNGREEEMFADYFGIGTPQLSSKEISKKYNINPGTLMKMASVFKKNNPHLQLTHKIENSFENNLAKYKSAYYSYYGIGGQKKTQREIADDLGCSRGSVCIMINKYQKYLDSLPPEEQEKLLREDPTSEKE